MNSTFEAPFSGKTEHSRIGEIFPEADFFFSVPSVVKLAFSGTSESKSAGVAAVFEESTGVGGGNFFGGVCGGGAALAVGESL
jgi:hypothetical protein